MARAKLNRHRPEDKALKKLLRVLRNSPDVRRIIAGIPCGARRKGPNGLVRIRVVRDTGVEIQAVTSRGLRPLYIVGNPQTICRLLESYLMP